MVKLAPLSEVFNAAKKRIVAHNLSIQEIADNSNVSEEIVEILLNNKNNVVNELSRVVAFLKINTYYKELVFTPYKIIDSGKQLKVIRIIKPRASIYFDKPTHKFYSFATKHKRHNKVSEALKDLIMSEMQDFTENYLKNN